MSIRKEGRATGEVTEVEDNAPVTKLGAAGQPWGEEDERQLMEENQETREEKTWPV